MPFSLNSFIDKKETIDTFTESGELLDELGPTTTKNSIELKNLYLKYIEKINYKPILNEEHLNEMIKIQKQISEDISQNQKRGTFKKMFGMQSLRSFQDMVKKLFERRKKLLDKFKKNNTKDTNIDLYSVIYLTSYYGLCKNKLSINDIVGLFFMGFDFIIMYLPAEQTNSISEITTEIIEKIKTTDFPPKLLKRYQWMITILSLKFNLSFNNKIIDNNKIFNLLNTKGNSKESYLEELIKIIFDNEEIDENKFKFLKFILIFNITIEKHNKNIKLFFTNSYGDLIDNMRYNRIIEYLIKKYESSTDPKKAKIKYVINVIVSNFTKDFVFKPESTNSNEERKLQESVNALKKNNPDIILDSTKIGSIVRSIGNLKEKINNYSKSKNENKRNKKNLINSIRNFKYSYKINETVIKLIDEINEKFKDYGIESKGFFFPTNLKLKLNKLEELLAKKKNKIKKNSKEKISNTSTDLVVINIFRLMEEIVDEITKIIEKEKIEPNKLNKIRQGLLSSISSTGSQLSSTSNPNRNAYGRLGYHSPFNIPTKRQGRQGGSISKKNNKNRKVNRSYKFAWGIENKDNRKVFKAESPMNAAHEAFQYLLDNYNKIGRRPIMFSLKDSKNNRTYKYEARFIKNEKIIKRTTA